MPTITLAAFRGLGRKPSLSTIETSDQLVHKGMRRELFPKKWRRINSKKSVPFLTTRASWSTAHRRGEPDAFFPPIWTYDNLHGLKSRETSEAYRRDSVPCISRHGRLRPSLKLYELLPRGMRVAYACSSVPPPSAPATPQDPTSCVPVAGSGILASRAQKARSYIPQPPPRSKASSSPRRLVTLDCSSIIDTSLKEGEGKPTPLSSPVSMNSKDNFSTANPTSMATTHPRDPSFLPFSASSSPPQPLPCPSGFASPGLSVSLCSRSGSRGSSRHRHPPRTKTAEIIPRETDAVMQIPARPRIFINVGAGTSARRRAGAATGGQAVAWRTLRCPRGAQEVARANRNNSPPPSEATGEFSGGRTGWLEACEISRGSAISRAGRPPRTR